MDAVGTLARRAEERALGRAPKGCWFSRRYRPIAYSALVSYAKDPRVDAYIVSLPIWQQQICHRVRDLVHGADPAVEETIKRRVQPYFVLDGNICALLAAKDHVNVFLYDGGIVPDPEGIITAGHNNKTARTVAFRESETINEPALMAMFRQIVAQQPGRRLAQDQGRLRRYMRNHHTDIHA